MVPIPLSPLSLKRSTSPNELEEDDRTSKRSKTSKTADKDGLEAQTPEYMGLVADLYDEKPRQLLMRSVALALEHVGFDGATPEAIEAICSEADVYAAMFLSQITTSMESARRALPTPIDFQYGLRQMGLSTSSMQPHLKPPIARDRLLIQLEPPSPTIDKTQDLEQLIGDELSGEPDKNARAYIPKHLPPFPSKHTYKWTEKDSIRETDARKIREEAAHQARQGEEALRRLITVSKVGKETGLRHNAQKTPKSKQRLALWEQALAGATKSAAAGTLNNNSLTKEVERSIVVNASSAYHRKGVTGKRKGVPQLPADMLGE